MLRDVTIMRLTTPFLSLAAQSVSQYSRVHHIGRKRSSSTLAFYYHTPFFWGEGGVRGPLAETGRERRA